MRSKVFLIALFFAAWGLSGCVIYERSADVRAYWTFAGMGCRDARVDLLQVTLERSRGAIYRDSGVVSCSEGAVDFFDLEPGRYRITALGFGRRGAYATWDLDLWIELHGGFNEFTLELVPVGSL